MVKYRLGRRSPARVERSVVARQVRAASDGSTAALLLRHKACLAPRETIHPRATSSQSWNSTRTTFPPSRTPEKAASGRRSRAASRARASPSGGRRRPDRAARAQPPANCVPQGATRRRSANDQPQGVRRPSPGRVPARRPTRVCGVREGSRGRMELVAGPPSRRPPAAGQIR